MTADLKTAVLRSIEELRRTIAEKTAEIEQLEDELKRHESALELLAKDGTGMRAGNGSRRGRIKLRDVLEKLPERFTSRDFVKAAVRTKKPSVYLRQTLSRWARQGKIKRVERGKYHKVRSSSAHRMAA
jgi:hypothetical protein